MLPTSLEGTPNISKYGPYRVPYEIQIKYRKPQGPNANDSRIELAYKNLRRNLMVLHHSPLIEELLDGWESRFVGPNGSPFNTEYFSGK